MLTAKYVLIVYIVSTKTLFHWIISESLLIIFLIQKAKQGTCDDMDAEYKVWIIKTIASLNINYSISNY